MAEAAGWRAARALANRSGSAAFLAYHSVSSPGPRILSLPPETFERHLAHLARHGWDTGGLDDLAGVAAGRRPERRQAFLTFDDGYLDNHDTVLPLLREHRRRAFVFVLPPAVDAGGPLAWPEVAERHRAHPEVMRSMTWPMVEALAEAGVEIGSHTCSHPRLPELGAEALAQELLDSRRRIAERLGRCDVLAYPFGDWSPEVARAAAAAGYSFAFSLPTGAQWRADALSIPRIPVDARDDERRFAIKLTAAGRALLLSPAKELVRLAARTARGARGGAVSDGAARG